MNRWRFRWALSASATCAFLLLLTFLRRLSAASEAFRLAAPSAKSTSGMQYLRPGLIITSWAYRHRYDLRVVPFDIDPRAPKGWNKWLALNATLAASDTALRPWVMWIDGDAIISHSSRSVESLMQSQTYSCDLTVDGIPETFYGEFDFHSGWNTGVFVARTTTWLASFIAGVLDRVLDSYQNIMDVAAAECNHPECSKPYAKRHLSVKLTQRLPPENNAGPKRSISAQLVLGYMLAKERRAEADEHVCLTPWMLQVHWQDAKELESEGKAIDALSVHYSGCNWCRNRTAEKAQQHQRYCMEDLHKRAVAPMEQRK